MSFGVMPARESCAVRHSNDQLAEVVSLQHADERFWCFLQTVDDIFAITDATIGDAGADLAQEFGVVLFSKFVVDETAHRQAPRQDLAHGGGQPVGAVTLSDSV